MPATKLASVDCAARPITIEATDTLAKSAVRKRIEAGKGHIRSKNPPKITNLYSRREDSLICRADMCFTTHEYGVSLMTHLHSPKRRTKLTGALLAATVASTGFVSLAPSAALAVPAGGYADLIEQFSLAVVLVEVTQKATPVGAGGGMPSEEFLREFQRRFGNNMPQMPNVPDRQGLGSGFIISSDGLIVTNNHVIAGATTVTVKFADGSEYEATVVGTDPLTDIALLDIEGSDLPTVTFGSSETMRVGDEVIAMGNPFGLGGTVTTGIVSAKDRNINAGPFDEFIQTDAAINQGNSGGPLFNDKGEVIGVNTAIFSPDGASAGIGFAVPSDLVAKVVADLQDDGQIDRGWLGVQIKPVSDEVASILGLQEGQGTQIEKVVDGAPAQKAPFDKRRQLRGQRDDFRYFAIFRHLGTGQACRPLSPDRRIVRTRRIRPLPVVKTGEFQGRHGSGPQHAMACHRLVSAGNVRGLRRPDWI